MLKATFFYLKTCDTCRRILKELNVPDELILREIKSSPVTPAELENIKVHFASYEELFNKRAVKFRSIDSSSFKDVDYKKLLLSDYTFLKRPVLLMEDKAFAGNSKETI
ncbi:MAG: arsenate reductase family protein, partial [Crocinitomicaceae bacterium]